MFIEIELREHDVTPESCRNYIQRFELSPLKERDLLGIDGFTRLVRSMSIFDATHANMFQDMSQPLTSYFCLASHNTFLLGAQGTSYCSIQRYADVLRQGCRFIKVTAHDGYNGKPEVYNLYTSTNMLAFKDVIEIINANAFVTSPYPVILSLENHCSPGQQVLMAETMTSVFGTKLYLTPLNSDPLMQLPSPDSLQGKIILRSRRGTAIKVETVAVPEDNEVLFLELRRVPSKAKELVRSSLEKCVELHPTLGSLINICQSQQCIPTFEASVMTSKPWFSRSIEGSELKLIQKKSSVTDLTVKEFTTCYPGALWAMSDNYDPFFALTSGVQAVCMNFQTQDKYMQVMHGLFRQNARCGYILKPAILRDPVQLVCGEGGTRIAGLSDTLNRVIVLSFLSNSFSIISYLFLSITICILYYNIYL